MEEWIRSIKFDPKFYWIKSKSAEEMEVQEMIILNLASKYLKRRITLIPFLEGNEGDSFFPHKEEYLARNTAASKAASYYLLGCNTARHHNFFASVFLQ